MMSKEDRSFICDICGNEYFNSDHEKDDCDGYLNMCKVCFDNCSGESLTLITEETDDSLIPKSVLDETDGGKGDDDD